MSISLSGTLSWKIIPCAQNGRRPTIPRHQYDNLRCDLTSSVLVGYESGNAPPRSNESPVVYLLVASMGEVRRLNRRAIAIETAPTRGGAHPQNEYVVLTAATAAAAQAWLDALCDAVEDHNRGVRHATAPPTQPPCTHPSAYHQYAPPPPISTHPARSPSGLKSRDSPASLPGRASVRFAGETDLQAAHRSDCVIAPLACSLSPSTLSSSSCHSHTVDVDADDKERAEAVRTRPRTSLPRWRPNPKPLLSDVVHNGVYPSHPVLAPSFSELLSANDMSPNRRHTHRGSKNSRRQGQPAGAPSDCTTWSTSNNRADREDDTHDGAEASSEDAARPASSGTSPRPIATTKSNEARAERERESRSNTSSGRRTQTSVPSHERGAAQEHTSASSSSRSAPLASLPVSEWRWGPAEPGPAVPAAVLAMASDRQNPYAVSLLKNSAHAKEVSAVSAVTDVSRPSLTPQIQYGAFSQSRRPSARSGSASSPSRWAMRDPAGHNALTLLSSPRRERSPFPWREPMTTVVATDAQKDRGRRSRSKRDTSRRSRRRDDADDEDAHGRYRSSRSTKHSSGRHDSDRYKKRRSGHGAENHPSIDDDNVAFLCQPQLYLKYDVQADSGRAPALHYVFLTVDVQHLVAVPAQIFEAAIDKAGLGKRQGHPNKGGRHRSSGDHPTVAVRSLDRALNFFGKSCTAISLRSILRVRRGCDEPMITDNPDATSRFVDKGCVVCVVADRRAFFLESKSQAEARRVVDVFDAILAKSIP